ncbi:MAG: hypothetical protein M3R43_05070 [Acidobacteriota bacterium]|nr:hypothetical protein [Acidobacteriota bacterium]
MISFTQCFRRLAGLSIGAVLLAFAAGCASPGPPRAPSLRVPEPVGDLTAERRGATVVLRFSTPVRTTDGGAVIRPLKASFCRAAGDGPCRPTASFPGRLAIAGPVEWVDTLPPDLAAGAARRLTYRVEVFNVEGRSAGSSEPEFAAAGEAPRGVEAFRADGSHAGVVLHWEAQAETHSSDEVLVRREALNLSPPPSKSATPEKSTVARRGVGIHKSRDAGNGATNGVTNGGPISATRAVPSQDQNSVWLRAPANAPDSDHGSDSGGLLDATARPNEPYRYTAVRNRTVTLDSRKLELRSGPSAAVTFTLRDVYTPRVPQALLTAGFPVQGSDSIAVDLVWQPNTESDVAGYNVYRQPLATGAAMKLNAKPVPLPAFHDATAARGIAYRYTVTAVDSKGNESEPSAPANLTATP